MLMLLALRGVVFVVRKQVVLSHYSVLYWPINSVNVDIFCSIFSALLFTINLTYQFLMILWKFHSDLTHCFNVLMHLYELLFVMCF